MDRTTFSRMSGWMPLNTDHIFSGKFDQTNLLKMARGWGTREKGVGVPLKEMTEYSQDILTVSLSIPVYAVFSNNPTQTVVCATSAVSAEEVKVS